MDPEPDIRAIFREQPAGRVTRPDQGEEDQQAEEMHRDIRHNRIGQVSRRAEHYSYEKIHEKLRPQESLRWAMNQRKQNRRDDDGGGSAKLPFENYLAVAAERGFFRQRGGQGRHPDR